MWLRSSMFAATVCWWPPIPMTRSTTGRARPSRVLPVRTRETVWMGPAPISAASRRSMLVRAAPVSAFATTVRVPPVPVTTTCSVKPIVTGSSKDVGSGWGVQDGSESSSVAESSRTRSASTAPPPVSMARRAMYGAGLRPVAA